MPTKYVAVTDSVFPNLDPAREVLAKIGAEIRLAKEPKPDAILDVARDADAMLATYAKVPAEMIQQLTRCRVIARRNPMHACVWPCQHYLVSAITPISMRCARIRRSICILSVRVKLRLFAI